MLSKYHGIIGCVKCSPSFLYFSLLTSPNGKVKVVYRTDEEEDDDEDVEGRGEV